MSRPRLLSASEAGGADDGGHGAERADRRDPHDHRHEAEDEPLEVLDAGEDRLAGAAHLLQREADEQRDEQRLAAPSPTSAPRRACRG